MLIRRPQRNRPTAPRSLISSAQLDLILRRVEFCRIRDRSHGTPQPGWADQASSVQGTRLVCRIISRATNAKWPLIVHMCNLREVPRGFADGHFLHLARRRLVSPSRRTGLEGEVDKD